MAAALRLPVLADGPGREKLRWELSLARYKQGLLSRRPSRPEPAVPWEELPLYWPLPVPGAEPQGALDEARTFYMENTLAMESELSVSGSLPAPLSRRNLTVDMRVTELRDAQGRGVPFRLAPNQPGVDAYNTGDLTPTRVFRILVPAKGHTFPRQLDGWTGAGVAKLRVPVRYRVISFTAADVGKTRGTSPSRPGSMAACGSRMPGAGWRGRADLNRSGSRRWWGSRRRGGGSILSPPTARSP